MTRYRVTTRCETSGISTTSTWDERWPADLQAGLSEALMPYQHKHDGAMCVGWTNCVVEEVADGADVESAHNWSA